MESALIYLTSGKCVHMDVSEWDCENIHGYCSHMQCFLENDNYILVNNTLVTTEHVEAVEFFEDFNPKVFDELCNVWT